MSRNGSGTYTLPAGNPVVTGTTIESNWANTTLSDIATTLTDSLSRSGQGGMTAALRLADGTQGAPGLGFANETGSGLYRAGTGEVWAVVQGAQTLNLDANGVTVPSDKATSIEGTFVFNETGADKDARFEGDTDANLLFVDASADAIGIGTSSPGVKLEVSSTSAGATVETLRLSNPGAGANTQAQIKFFTTSTNYGTISGGYGASAPQMTFDLPNGTPGNYVWQISSSEKMRLDSSGNLGLGVTPSAWGTSGTVLKAMQLGSGNGFVAGANGFVGTYLGANAYYNGTNWIYSTTAAAAYYNVQAGAHAWFTAPSGTAGNAISFTQAMTLDASGNLLTGVTTQIFPASNRKTVEVNGTSQALYGLGVGGTTAGYLLHDGTDMSLSQTRAGALVLGTNNAERARITSGGDLLVGTTSNTESSRIFVSYPLAQSGGAAAIGTEVDDTTALRAIAFRNPNGLVGTITTSGSATNYNTSSDYRLKDSPQPLTGSGAFIDALQPKTWNWKADGSRGVGFIAHEAQAVSPGSVVGTKDAVDADGKPVMQAMEYGSAEFIANIIAELQSLRARVAALEAQ